MKKISVLKREWLLREIQKLAQKRVSKADIARELDVKPQYLNSILNSDRGVTDQFLDKFIEKYAITHIDLFPSPMFSHEDQPGVPEQPRVSLEVRLLEIIKEKDNRIEEQARIIGHMEERLGNSKSYFRADRDRNILPNNGSDTDNQNVPPVQELPKSPKPKKAELRTSGDNE